MDAKSTNNRMFFRLAIMEPKDNDKLDFAVSNSIVRNDRF